MSRSERRISLVVKAENRFCRKLSRPYPGIQSPTLIGDTIHLEMEVKEKQERDASSGVVTFRWEVLNQNGETVCARDLQALVARQRKQS